MRKSLFAATALSVGLGASAMENAAGRFLRAPAAHPDAERQKQTSLAAINKMITSIARSAQKLNESIHNAGLMVMQHAKDFGDTSPAARLVDALPMSHRRSLLINWFGQFSPIVVGKDAKTEKMKAHLKGTADERNKLWMLDEAKATPFWALPEAQREPDVPSYNGIHNNIVSMIDRNLTKADSIPDENEKQKAKAELFDLAKAINYTPKAVTAQQPNPQVAAGQPAAKKAA